VSSVEETADVDFMTDRCLALCISDRKGAIAGGRSFGFNVSELGENNSPSLFVPLSLLMHAQRLRGALWRVLDRTLTSVRRPKVDSETSRNASPADLRTSLRQAFMSTGRRGISAADALSCAVVGEEFVRHCSILAQLFGNQKREIKNPALLKMVQSFESTAARMREEWDAMAKTAELPLGNVKARLSEAGCMDTDDEPTMELLERISECLGPIYSQCDRRARFARGVLAWREHWRMGASGVSAGTQQNYTQTRTTPALYELWCFLEVANALMRTGNESFVQNSLLRGSSEAPLFTGTNHYDVFYDYYNNAKVLPKERLALEGIHVEWFLLSKTRYSDSIVIDTKYKSSESVNFLTTLGYMNAYQVRRGIVIFRDSLAVNAFQPSRSAERFALSTFGEGDDHFLCGVQLVPAAAEVDRNAEVLEKLIATVILKGSGT